LYNGRIKVYYYQFFGPRPPKPGGELEQKGEQLMPNADELL